MPGGAAEPPATGHSAELVAAVRQRVRELGWQQWAASRGIVGFTLSQEHATRLTCAMAAAIGTVGITLDQATEVAQHALLAAKTANAALFVANAFTPKTLAEWLRRLTAEPLAARPLPLPAPLGEAEFTAATQPGEPEVGSAGTRSAAAAAPVPTAPAHCGECGNPALGDQNPAIQDVRHRITVDDRGDTVPCRCHPLHPSHRAEEVGA